MLSGGSSLTALAAADFGSMPRLAAGTAARRDRERPQGLPGKPFVALQELGAARIAERLGLARLPDVAALGEQDFRRAFDEDAQLGRIVEIGVHRGVALALRRERDFGDTRQAFEIGRADAELARGDHQSAFGRVAVHGPASVALRQS